MSHDRGCWKCFRDQWEYRDCRAVVCPKRYRVLQEVVDAARKRVNGPRALKFWAVQHDDVPVE